MRVEGLYSIVSSAANNARMILEYMVASSSVCGVVHDVNGDQGPTYLARNGEITEVNTDCSIPNES